MGYEDPALEGQTITITCPPGWILNGSNSSTCMENGIWEPDPGNAECTLSGGFITTVATPILGTVVLVDMIIQVYHCKHDCLFYSSNV